MKVNREYYWNYMQECDRMVEEFVVKAKELYNDVFHIGTLNLEKPVKNFLWESVFFGPNRVLYSKIRSERQDHLLFLQKIWMQQIAPLLPIADERDGYILNASCPSVDQLLQPFRNHILFYCKNDRQMQYYKPILERITEPVVLLTREHINENSLDKPNIQVIEYDMMYQKVFISSKYFQQKFPFIFYLTNSLYAIIKGLSPHCVFLMEGCHFETEVLSSVCKNENIPTICIQQGWPALMHTRFKNMTYDYFFSWGKAFRGLWEKHNPAPQFKEMGYIYPVSRGLSKTAICFFFQAPLFIIDQQTIDEMVRFMIYCAGKFSARGIYLREHPEYPFENQIRFDIKQHKNIEVVTQWEISEVFERTEIGVSVFSSTLMEGIRHGTIPFVFNLTSCPGYYPEVESEGIGVEANSFEEAVVKIEKLTSDKCFSKAVKQNISVKKSFYFELDNEKGFDSFTEFLAMT